MGRQRRTSGQSGLILALMLGSVVGIALEVQVLSAWADALALRVGTTAQRVISGAILLVSVWAIRWGWVACLKYFDRPAQGLPRTDDRDGHDGDTD